MKLYYYDRSKKKVYKSEIKKETKYFYVFEEMNMGMYITRIHKDSVGSEMFETRIEALQNAELRCKNTIYRLMCRVGDERIEIEEIKMKIAKTCKKRTKNRKGDK